MPGMTAKNCLLLVIGDSFTREFWQDYFSLHASKYIWIHHELCGFAVSVVEKHAPDIVILAPAERQMFLLRTMIGHGPQDVAASSAASAAPCVPAYRGRRRPGSGRRPPGDATPATNDLRSA